MAGGRVVVGYLGLGSNVGDRLRALRRACHLLADHGVRVTRASSVYETEPQGEMLDQPDFLNACVEVETELGPEELLDACKVVERELGRMVAGPRHGPRPIDVDVLVLGDLVHESERLTIPHPDVLARRFVVEPLVELDPDLELPGGRRVADALGAVSDQRVEAVGSLAG
ncbi:MAG TPA: 2-amino-4-hydroxy-6-hydroxymethyldihydropteridine diphosphokinase [Thermoleophilaceae bacterium]